MGKTPHIEGIVEADETYIACSSRKDYDKEEGEPRKRWRGTAKYAVIGVVTRGMKVVAELVSDIAGETIADFIKRVVKTEDAKLYTDQFKVYNSIGKEMEHDTINPSEQCETDGIHTNTMDGFWSFVKRAWYGSHYHYSTGYTPLYLTEACYKYYYRGTNIFAKFLTESMESR